jgi:hypothetical protein
VTTPYTEVAEASGFYVCGFRSVDITDSRWIRGTYSEGLIYEFSFDLECFQVGWDHGYMVRHEELTKAGKLSSVLDDSYRDAQLKAVRYWNGSEWVAAPVKNLR